MNKYKVGQRVKITPLMRHSGRDQDELGFAVCLMQIPDSVITDNDNLINTQRNFTFAKQGIKEVWLCFNESINGMTVHYDQIMSPICEHCGK